MLLVLSHVNFGFGQTSPLATIAIQTVPSPDTSVSFRGIFALDAQTAWVCGSRGALFRSENSREFVRITIPNSADSDFRDVHCFDDKTVLVMSVGPGSKSRIYKTTDRGASWQVVFTNPHDSGFLNSIAFWDDRRGIAVGDPVAGHLYVLLTSDGGRRWREAEPDVMPGALANEHSFAASGTCVTVFGSMHAFVGMGGAAARVVITRDGGQSWSAHETPILHSRDSAGIFSVLFRSSDNGIVVGGDYTREHLSESTVALTTDGGETWWTPSDAALPFQSSVNEILFAGDLYWITTGPVGTHVSKNGLNWNRLQGEGYHCLSVTPDQQTVWLAGSSGRVGILDIKE